MTTVPRFIVLVGLMGSGKSTVARILAESTGRRLVDTDDLVEEMTGRTVRDIFTEDGEERFRDLESVALGRALSDGPCVVAAAGGSVLRRENRELIDGLRVSGECAVAWLVAPASELARRTASGGHRPLIDDDRLGRLSTMETQRAPLYEQVADLVVDTSTSEAAAVADSILAAFAERGMSADV